MGKKYFHIYFDRYVVEEKSNKLNTLFYTDFVQCNILAYHMYFVAYHIVYILVFFRQTIDEGYKVYIRNSIKHIFNKNENVSNPTTQLDIGVQT